jgi:hypothetical protein
MRIACGIVGLAQTALLLCFSTTAATAQECVKWSTYSCMDYAPGVKPPAKPDEELAVSVVPTKDKTILDPRKLYRVDVTCNSTRVLPAPSQGIFSRTDVVASHFIAITDQALTGPTLPTQARVLIPVYSVSTDNANKADFINKACNTSFFIPGSKRLYVAATVNRTQNTKPSLITSLFFTGLKIVNPVWPLFVGSEAAALLKPKIEGIAATEGPLQELFSHFKSGETVTTSERIYLGERNIRTDYSRTTIKVSPIPSLIQTNHPDFVVAFEESLTGYSDKLAVPANTAETDEVLCKQFGNQLLAQTFPTEDVAYGLSYITRTAGLDKAKSIACLGDEYGLVSVESFTCPPPGEGLKCLWNRFPNPLVVANFKNPYPIQKYEAPFFKGLRNALNDYAEAGPNGDDASRAELAKYLQDEIEFEDADDLVEGKDGKISSDEFARQLVANDYKKFGCPAKDSQAAGLLLGFPPKPGAGDLYQGDSVVTLRNWIGESKKVFKVEALLEPGLAEAAAKPTLMWCGKGVHLAATPEPKKEAPAGGGAGQ